MTQSSPTAINPNEHANFRAEAIPIKPPKKPSPNNAATNTSLSTIVNIPGVESVSKSLLGVLVLAALSLILTLTAAAARSEPNITSELGGTPATGSSSPERAATQEAGIDAQPTVTPKSTPMPEPNEKSLLSFFLIGVVINLVMIFAVGIWAYREWQKRS